MTPRVGTLLRIFVDEEERAGGRPLYMALVDELRNLGFSGATVLKGIEGYGSRREVHAMRSFDLSTSLPVLIEVVEDDEKIAAAVPRLRALVTEGLMTLEKIYAM